LLDKRGIFMSDVLRSAMKIFFPIAMILAALPAFAGKSLKSADQRQVSQRSRVSAVQFKPDAANVSPDARPGASRVTDSITMYDRRRQNGGEAFPEGNQRGYHARSVRRGKSNGAVTTERHSPSYLYPHDWP